MKRSDGVLLKSLDPFVKIIPYIMERRSDAQNFAKRLVCVDSVDRYIQEKKKQGIRISYLHLFIAAYVRVIDERPQLNRFIMNSRIYQRNNICISMAIKRSLRSDDDEETTVKFEFTGKENIFEVIEIVDNLIAEAIAADADTDTDKLAALIMSMPGIVTKLLVKTIKLMDRWNMLPASVIKASPFHTTLFFTYLKSINTNYIYHHLYDFGTTGLFVALGKPSVLPVVQNGQVVAKRCCEIGYTMDERICDGLYFSRSFKLLEKYLENPHLLESRDNSRAKQVEQVG
ncbi:MAG: 2-oxoglutarate dehydrogenase [Firmicutes bacterium]|nr:2-oxoglutarate dehydrogenase [Bacillota bacterium]